MKEVSVTSHLLEKYARASNDIVLSKRSDLDPGEMPMPQMLTWCREQGRIVVMESGVILTSSPTDRRVQNCKVVMLNQGLKPKRVRAATDELIALLLENEPYAAPHADDAESITAQQQRLRLLVEEAIEMGASDIHIEVREALACVHFRVNGELYLQAEWLPQLGWELAAVAFNRETDHADTHFNPWVPQNASMPLKLDNREVRLRLASLPAHGGFDLVMRLLTTGDQKILSLHALGYPAGQARVIAKAAQLASGAVIVAGPTGSGKTTTLASCMQLVGAERKVYTIEDPVERLISTATQVPIQTEHFERSFASMSRAVLRMDPDVMVIGEMRDLETAQVVVRAALTGHLVFSTLHTNSAMAIVRRLVDMGLSRSLLSDQNFLACLVCQRLLPKLCLHCAVPLSRSGKYLNRLEAWRRIFGGQIDAVRVRGSGACELCQGTGLCGRTVIAEIIWMDDVARQSIDADDMIVWEKHLRANGWESYGEKAMALVASGLVDPADAERVCGEMNLVKQRAHFQYHEFN